MSASETQTPPPVQRCAAPPFQIIFCAAALFTFFSSGRGCIHRSSSFISAASAPAAELCQSYLSQILASGRERLSPCEEIAAAVASAAAAVLTPQPGLPHPSSPFTRAGQPRKAWLDFREAQILQPRQSRLHRWLRGGLRGRDATVCHASPQWTVRGRRRRPSVGD